MLYDPKRWEKPKADVWSIEGLIDWLKSCSPEQEYYWPSGSECLLGRYLTAMGKPALPCTYYKVFARKKGKWWWPFFSDTHAMNRYCEVARERPWTFGAALDRACRVRDNG